MKKFFLMMIFVAFFFNADKNLEAIPSQVLKAISSAADAAGFKLGGVQEPSLHSTQGSSLFDGGRFNFNRTNKDIEPTQVFNFEAPSLKVSCNGFNGFGASMGWLNGTQVRELIGKQFKEGMAFATVLAVKSIAPVVASTGTFITSILSRMHALNVKRCDDMLAKTPDIQTAKQQIARFFNTVQEAKKNKESGVTEISYKQDENQEENKGEEEMEGEMRYLDDTLSWILNIKEAEGDAKKSFGQKIQAFFAKALNEAAGANNQNINTPKDPIKAWKEKWEKYLKGDGGEKTHQFLEALCGTVSGKNEQKAQSKFQNYASGKEFFVSETGIKADKDGSATSRFFTKPLTQYTEDHLCNIQEAIKREGVKHPGFNGDTKVFLEVAIRYPVFQYVQQKILSIEGAGNHSVIAEGIAADILFQMASEAITAVLIKASFFQSSSKSPEPWKTYVRNLKQARQTLETVCNKLTKNRTAEIKELLKKIKSNWEEEVKEMLAMAHFN